MNRTVMNTLILTLFGGTLAACGGGSGDGSSGGASQLLAASTEAVACFTPWNSGTAYNGGGKASYNNVNYTANWWTQGNNPSTSSGGAGSGQPWTAVGDCGTPTTNADSNSNAYPDANADSNADSDANAYSDTNPDSNAHAYPHRPGETRADRLLAQLHQPQRRHLPDQPGQR